MSIQAKIPPISDAARGVSIFLSPARDGRISSEKGARLPHKKRERDSSFRPLLSHFFVATEMAYLETIAKISFLTTQS